MALSSILFWLALHYVFALSLILGFGLLVALVVVGEFVAAWRRK